MPSSIRLDGMALDATFWPHVAQRVSAWAAAQGVALRDAVLLVPQIGALPAARAAFAALAPQDGWPPRIETVQTLAESLGPPAAAMALDWTGDAALDRVTVGQLLGQAGVHESDPRAWDDALQAVLATTASLIAAAAARAPAQRDAWWAALREALPAGAGPGSAERRLARIAIAWAAACPAPRSDRLWTLRPAAWIALRAGGADPLVEALLQAAEGPVLWLDVAAPAGARFDLPHGAPVPRRLRAQGFEDEARAASLAVIEALDRGQAPVALIAEDRRLTRRVRALLARGGTRIGDETGWTLSTTRAAARVFALLDLAGTPRSRDALMEALKDEDPTAAAQLEPAWRRQREPAPAALAVAERFAQAVASWAGGSRSLTQWLAQWPAAGAMRRLGDDEAGREVLAALRLDAVAAADPLWRSRAEGVRWRWDEFSAWVRATLEAARYRPTPPPEPEVLIVPLRGALLRSFGAVVFAGADATRLGAWPSLPGLLPRVLTETFGIEDAASRREREAAAFAMLLRHPNLTLLRRAFEAAEPLPASPWVERAAAAWRAQGLAVPDEAPVTVASASVAPRRLHRPAPTMADALPAQLSASSIELLRSCPYRFFARFALGLREGEELDAALDKRDHGNWLHAVLLRFHEARAAAAPTTPDDDRRYLLDAAEAGWHEAALDAAEHWPFRAGFEAFADRYLAWCRDQEQQGWRFHVGEVARRIAPPELGGIAIDSRIDRIDLHKDGGARVIDYKTGTPDALAATIHQRRSEDTQLAVYAALLTEEPHEPPPRALYLALDERKPPREIEHPQVEASAALLIEGLAADLDALRAGVGAPALGEVPTCERCEARGLCRRDHRATTEDAAS